MDFVSFEIAKKLKEKGYSESWDYVYNDDGEICIPCYNLTEEDTIPMCPAPQIHEVLKWLRDEKGLHIEVRVDSRGFGACINHYDINTLELISFNPLLYHGFSKTYEEAALAGIKYVIDNSI